MRKTLMGLLAGTALAIPLLVTQPVSAESLPDALARAYNGNPDIKAARARLRQVNEQVPQALSFWRPTIEVTGSGGVQRVTNDNAVGKETETTNPLEARLQVRQNLYRGGRTQAQTERAEYQVEGERESLRSTEQLVLFEAARAYMDVWRDLSVLELNTNNEAVLARELQAAQDRFEVGEVTRTDVAQSEARLARATADRLLAEGNLEISRAVYEEIVGAPPRDLTPPPSLEGLPFSLEEALSRGMEANPDVRAANLAERAADRNVRLVLGELYPELALVGTLSHVEDQTFDDVETDRAQLLAQLTVPLYQSGSVSSRVRQAKQANSEALMVLESERRRINQEIVSSWEGLVSSRAQITAFESEVRSAEIALEGVRQENQVGSRTTLDVLDQEQELLDAQVNLVRAQRDEIVASFRLLAAVGRLDAYELGLPVQVYDPKRDYDVVRDLWFGLDAPGTNE